VPWRRTSIGEETHVCGGGVDDSKVFGLEISKMVLERSINEHIPCKVKNSVHLRLCHIKYLMKLLQIEASDANVPGKLNL